MKKLLNLKNAKRLNKNQLRQIKGKGLALLKGCLNSGATCREGLQCCSVDGLFRCVDPNGPQGTNCFVIEG